jgi:large subunit ribosomal protein L22
MKEVKVKLSYLKIAPRKVRLVAGVLKGLSANEAEAQLLISSKRAGLPIIKLLRSAIANAKHNYQLNPDTLFIKDIRVDQGPMIKRYMPRAMGRATMIQKKTSHIILTLAESDKAKSPRFKITVVKKISKTKAQKIAKARATIEEKKEKEINKEKTGESKKQISQKTGFMKKVFSRKSI